MVEYLNVAYGKNLSRTSLVVTLFITVAIAFGGCAENYGRLQRSEEVDTIFINYRVLPDYKYYYTGPDGRPDVIMGIQNEYTLETTHWTPFNASDDILKKWVDSINFHPSTGVRYYPYGFFILDPEGNRLGVWYSICAWAAVMMKDDERIQVFPPGNQAMHSFACQVVLVA